MQFYTGVVEDVMDPLELGRARVRVVGLHTFDKVLIPTESLPWASTLMPVTSASAEGTGMTPKFRPFKSWVLVYFLDGEDKQQPMIMGTIPGVASGTTIKINDVESFYDGQAAPSAEYSNEPDLPKNARSGATEGLRESVKLSGAVDFEEPEDLRANRQFPYNQVRQSESGHIEEWDDTPGNERIVTEHKTGTFNEMRPDGTQVNKIVGDGFEIIAQDKNVYVRGDCNIYVRGDANLSVTGDYNIDVNGDINYNVNGNIFYNVNEGIYNNVNGDIANYVVGDINSTIGGDITTDVTGDQVIQVGAKNVTYVYGDNSRIVSGNESNTVYGNSSNVITGGSYNNYLANVYNSYNASFVTSVFGEASVSVQGSYDLSSLGIMDISSTDTMTVAGNAGLNLSTDGGKMNIAASSGVDLSGGSSFNADAGTIDLNSGNSSAAATSARTVSIVEQDVSAVMETKPDVADIPTVDVIIMEPSDDEVIVDFPDDTTMSTPNGPQSLDDYITNGLHNRGGSANIGGNGANSSSTKNNFNESTYDGNGRFESTYSNVKYALGGTRNKVVNSVLEELLSNACTAAGLDTVTIYSGKQPGTTGGRTGSRRHDTGFAADIFLHKDGRKLQSNIAADRELMVKFVKIGVAMGLRGAGHSKGYMGYSNIHVDTLGQVVDKKGVYDSSRISTWLSDSWFIKAMHDPDSNHKPSANYQSSSATAPSVDIVDDSGYTPKIDKDTKEVAQILGQECLKLGFTEEEALAAISCAYHESKLQLVEESSYANTSNARIKKIFSSTRNLSDAELTSIKKSKKDFFEVVYGHKTRSGKNLGNTQSGDGGNYIGRGLIQLTGRWNYETYGGAKALANPEALSNDYQEAARVAANYLYKRYNRVKGKTGDVVKDMAWAIKGSAKGVSLTYAKDLKFFNSIDKSWLGSPETTDTATETTDTATETTDTATETTDTAAPENAEPVERDEDARRAIIEGQILGRDYRSEAGGKDQIRSLARVYPGKAYTVVQVGNIWKIRG